MAAFSIGDIVPAQLSLPVLAAASSILWLVSYTIYRSYLDGLSDVPGPLLCRLTILWTWYHSYIGDESTQIDKLHEKYGPVVRIGPHNVVFADGEALAAIYSAKGGFLKSPLYSNFDFEGHPTIFSALDPQHRSVRTKAVMPMFSTNSLREQIHVIDTCVGHFIKRLQQERAQAMQAKSKDGMAVPVNVLNLGRTLAIDTVCLYLFGKAYGGIEEQSGKLSASSYVDSFVAFGNIFFLPKWLFDPILTWSTWLWPSNEVAESENRVDDFTRGLVERSGKDENTYQSRLLKVGITPHETDIQMKDVIFAGTDTTGTNLGTLMWRLAKHPEVYKTIQQEIVEAEAADPNYDPQKLDYLQAVIREGLRLSQSNPTRFPRRVPPEGWTYKSGDRKAYHMPFGTEVGLSPHTLHFNPKVFPDSSVFKPERWLDNPTPEMFRDWIPFSVGARQCIARNLAMLELTLAVRALAKSDVLSGARPVQSEIRVMEWFNAKIIGEKIELVWE